MQLEIGALADAANVSQEGKLNITGIFDALNFAQVPATYPLMVLVLRLVAGIKKKDGLIR